MTIKGKISTGIPAYRVLEPVRRPGPHRFGSGFIPEMNKRKLGDWLALSKGSLRRAFSFLPPTDNRASQLLAHSSAA